MQNQQNKTIEVEKFLKIFRQNIDEIDHEIISLLEERMKIINQVALLKRGNKEKFFIRSSREADMIKELLNRPLSNFPKATIVNIWRKIITAANMHEQPITIALHNPKNISDYNYLIREFYNDEVPIISCDSAGNVVSEIDKNIAQIAIFALPNNESDEQGENWWINLANNKLGIKIFAKIPFLQFNLAQKNHNNIQLVAAAIKAPESSKQDNSLLCVELRKEFSKAQLLALFKEYDLKAAILKSAKLPGVEGMIFYLIDLEGFFMENDKIFIALKAAEIKPYIRVLGHYAVPIVLD